MSWQKILADNFTIKILIKILAANICMIDFFCKSMAASNFCHGKEIHAESLFLSTLNRSIGKMVSSLLELWIN